MHWLTRALISFPIIVAFWTHIKGSDDIMVAAAVTAACVYWITRPFIKT